MTDIIDPELSPGTKSESDFADIVGGKADMDALVAAMRPRPEAIAAARAAEWDRQRAALAAAELEFIDARNAEREAEKTYKETCAAGERDEGDYLEYAGMRKLDAIRTMYAAAVAIWPALGPKVVIAPPLYYDCPRCDGTGRREAR